MGAGAAGGSLDCWGHRGEVPSAALVCVDPVLALLAACRHDWSVCPFAHTGEMAARRDPSRYIPIFCFHSKQVRQATARSPVALRDA